MKSVPKKKALKSRKPAEAKPAKPISECMRCGTCCKKGGPSFHHADKTLIEAGVIESKYLYTCNHVGDRPEGVVEKDPTGGIESLVRPPRPLGPCYTRSGKGFGIGASCSRTSEQCPDSGEDPRRDRSQWGKESPFRGIWDFHCWRPGSG